ncbi:MAG TPA: hypothetical protein VG708_08320 [Mycobacteriales bacterium]|jgi:capsular polysaccharide biosynthesis protein|nr:hypothetical protein [Mycobacteriales bacterium]
MTSDAPGRPPAGRRLPIEVSAVTAILALALAIMAGAGAAVYQQSTGASYQSYSVLLIDQPTVIATTPSDAPLTKLQALRYQYAGLLRTDVIGAPVGRQLGVPTAQVESHLTALVDPSSFTFDIVARGADPSSSNKLAQAATEELIHYVRQQQANIGVQAIDRVVLTEVTTPTQGTKIAPGLTKTLASGVIAFIVVGVAFVIIADLLRRRR